MRNPWVPLLALAAASPAALALEVVHDPVTCTAARPLRPHRGAGRARRGGRRPGKSSSARGPQSDWYRWPWPRATAVDGAAARVRPRPSRASSTASASRGRDAASVHDAAARRVRRRGLSGRRGHGGRRRPSSCTCHRARRPSRPVPPGSARWAPAPRPGRAPGGKAAKALVGVGLAGARGRRRVAAGSATDDGSRSEAARHPDVRVRADGAGAPGASLSAQRDLLQVFVPHGPRAARAARPRLAVRAVATDGGPVCAGCPPSTTTRRGRRA